jgi:membrane protease YdiL (CAAX protease family)
LVVVYLRLAGRTLRDVGFHSKNLGAVLSFTVVGFGAVYALAFAIQLLILRATGEQASLILSAVDPKTGLSGGLAFAIWLLAANLVNSAMEEGLFRGVMLRHALRRFSKWGAIFLQAGLFSLWHLSWPLRHLLDGQIPVGEVVFEAFGLSLSTLLSGVLYGYFYYKTNSIWGPFVSHTLNNGIFNVLFIQTSRGIQSGLDFIPFTLLFLLGHLLMIPLIRVFTDWIHTPVVKPWGEFTDHEVSAQLE